ncbi:hypothetical protein Fmac_028660 [Flemingia macrophylla]|uniref:Uncharacterized protein n=1 Tax=Flemingia macrophylla TaxID=520843 RepID=A0ABD1L853_9FABA
MTTILVSVLLRSNLEWMSILRLMLQTAIAVHHYSRDKELDRKDGYQLLAVQGVPDVATDTSADTKKLEGKLDALVNLVTQLAVNQKPAFVARVCGIRSSNNHHTSVCPSSQQSGVDEHPEADAANTYSKPPQQGVHDVAKDASPDTRKLEGKLDALVNLVTQLTANQKPAFVARVYGIRSSNDHHTSVCPSSQQSGVDEHPEAYAQFSARNDVILIRRVHDVATDTSDETRKLEGKLDTHVHLVTQLAANQKPGFVARFCGIRSFNDHHTNQFSARNDVIAIRGVHHVATDTSPETRKLESKLDALVNLVTQLSLNQKPASTARVYGIHSSNHHHTNFSVRNDAIVIRGVHDVVTYTSAKTRKLEGKLDTLVNLVTQLAANQKPGFVARVYGIRSSKDHHTSVYPSSQQSGVDEHPEAYAANTYSKPPHVGSDAIVIGGVHYVTTNTSSETTKLEGKLDALVNLVTQLPANQKPASVARVCDIRSSDDHHTSVCPSSQQFGVDDHAEAYGANTYSKPPQLQRQGT